MKILGIDIGGTKCAVITAEFDGRNIAFLRKEKLATNLSVSPEEMIGKLIRISDILLEGSKPDAIGISCGGPLDSKNGVILCPPNLRGWINVKIKDIFTSHYSIEAKLQNDANAGAVAEWKFGAGKGCDNVIFLTFGTGLGAGLILGGRLYTGTNDNAGECGHIRLADFGPEGFGKAGSFEGFCSGNGIAKLGYAMALHEFLNGNCPAYYKPGMTPDKISAKSIADAAMNGDPTAVEVYKTSGTYLGKGLAMLIDILNPQKIIIGSIFNRAHSLLWESANNIISEESLPKAAEVCEIVPSALGENIGDYATVAVALA